MSALAIGLCSSSAESKASYTALLSDAAAFAQAREKDLQPQTGSQLPSIEMLAAATHVADIIRLGGGTASSSAPEAALQAICRATAP